MRGKSKAERTDVVQTNLGARGTHTEAPPRDVLSKDHRSKDLIEAKKLLAQVLSCFCVGVAEVDSWQIKLRTYSTCLQVVAI